jgi:ferredoxin
MQTRSKFLTNLKSKDPLVPLGIVIFVIGVSMLLYGLVPFQQAIYKQVAARSIPLIGPSGNFVQPNDAEAIFRQNYSGTGALDQVICDPSANGYDCYGFEQEGVGTFYNTSLQYYGAILAVIGGISAYVGNRFEPLKPKEKLTRPITIRVDESICIANTVCVELAPKVFQLKKQDRASIFAPLAYIVDPNGATNDEILIAAQMCPTGAIIIEDAETGERIHPPLPEG